MTPFKYYFLPILFLIAQNMTGQDYNFTVTECFSSTYNLEVDKPDSLKNYFYVKGTIDKLLVNESHQIEIDHIDAKDNNNKPLKKARPFIDRNYKTENELSFLLKKQSDSSTTIDTLTMRIAYTILEPQKETFSISDLTKKYKQNLLNTFDTSVGVTLISNKKYNALLQKIFKKKMKAYHKAQKKSGLSKEAFDKKNEFYLMTIETLYEPSEADFIALKIEDAKDEIEDFEIVDNQGYSMLTETFKTENLLAIFLKEPLQSNWKLNVTTHTKIETKIIQCSAYHLTPDSNKL